MTDPKKKNDAMIAALLREREGYVRSGKQERIKAVDDQLKLYGYKTEDETRKHPPQGRTAERPAQTTARPEATS